MSTLLQTCPKDSAGKIYATDATGAPTHYHNGLPYDGTGLAIDTVSAITNYYQGLPLTATGRIATVDAAPSTVGGGAAPFNSAGRLCAGDATPAQYNASVGYTSNGRVAIVSSGGGEGVVIVSDPSDTEVSVNFPATFSVTATGAPTLTYQWQEQVAGAGAWSNITNTLGSGGYSGATTNTLTCLAFLTGKNTNRYRCVVTNNVNSATSASAELLVAS